MQPIIEPDLLSLAVLLGASMFSLLLLNLGR
jgi:hypothetical protein